MYSKHIFKPPLLCCMLFSYIEKFPEAIIMITAEELHAQNEALLNSDSNRSSFIQLSERLNYRLPNDATQKSFAYWYDDDEARRINLGLRKYQLLSHFY